MIEAHDLTFTYAGGRQQALKGLSFAVERGEIFGFLGPSGAGKSTTQKILTRLLTGHGGRARVMGRPLEAWGSDYYERIGVSFELPNHYQKLSALENLNFFRALYAGQTADPSRLLERLGLGGDAHTRVAHYSKGMQMRLTLARALLHCPDLLFLDEPTSGLDPVNARVVREVIREQQAAGRTVVLTTHAMHLADEVCDRVAFIVDGEIVLIDSPRALKLRHGQRLARVEYRENGGTAWRDFPLEGLGDNAAFLDLLRRAPIETIHTREASLEEIFIQVTGRGLQ